MQEAPCPWGTAQAPCTAAPVLPSSPAQWPLSFPGHLRNGPLLFPGSGRRIQPAAPAAASPSVWKLNRGVLGFSQWLLPTHPTLLLLISNVAWALACLITPVDSVKKHSRGPYSGAIWGVGTCQKVARRFHPKRLVLYRGQTPDPDPVRSPFPWLRWNRALAGRMLPPPAPGSVCSSASARVLPARLRGPARVLGISLSPDWCPLPLPLGYSVCRVTVTCPGGPTVHQGGGKLTPPVLLSPALTTPIVSDYFTCAFVCLSSLAQLSANIRALLTTVLGAGCHVGCFMQPGDGLPPGAGISVLDVEAHVQNMQTTGLLSCICSMHLPSPPRSTLLPGF